MAQGINKDKKVWSFEPSQECRDKVNDIMAMTGWSRTKIIRMVLDGYIDTVVMAVIAEQKKSISEMESKLKQLQSIAPKKKKRKNT